MYKFYFNRDDDSNVHLVESPKQFLLLSGDANYCLSTSEINCVDENQDFVDETEPLFSLVSRYDEGGVLVIHVNDEEDAHEGMFSAPNKIKCRLVLCGDHVMDIPETFKKLCHVISETGAEPTDDDDRADNEEEEE